ncbi:uncharacterized protein LOC130948080 isoform X1 [Arachis stenosperma]|uniref:uncharacterized protein LOC130948080 isoform X1 n=1 Tax=Arachis stenosperma TaxID=217475 RepID=UPI0025ACE115|nr:uncharacterized protein LOC130948080 isoform X1 [Arachis stenosperma]
MGTMLEGHEILGFGFFVIGLWHLFNNIKIHSSSSSSSNSFKSTIWFPTKRFRYLELNFIIASCTMFIAMELFIAPDLHQPFDSDGSIPANHLHNFEHSLMASSFLVYAAFTMFFDMKSIITKAQHELTHFLASMAFAQQFLLIHFHTRDHAGVEGQYHYLLQILIVVSLTTTIMGIGFPNSFMVSFVRSLSITFQGLWLMIMGFFLWTPGYQAKGCSLHPEMNTYMVRCSDDKALHRAVSLVNLQFSWLLILVTVFAMCFFLVLSKRYDNKVEYVSLTKEEQLDLESQSEKKCIMMQVQI